MEEQSKYIDIISEIDSNYKIMQGMRPIPESAIRAYYEDFCYATAHSSTAIEGNTFSYDETILLLKRGVTLSNHTLKEHNELLGYSKGYWFLYQALKDNTSTANASDNKTSTANTLNNKTSIASNKDFITTDLINQIHKRVMFDEDYAGLYRNVDVVIGNSVTDKVDYEPPSFDKVPKLVQKYVRDVNAQLRDIVPCFRQVADLKVEPSANKLASNKNTQSSDENEISKSEVVDWYKIFHTLAEHHIKFERIHPYQDGNGRTGRLLLNFELMSLGLLPVDIRYQEKARYYSGLKNFDTKSKYSTDPNSKTDSMAKLVAESQLRSMEWWNKMFRGYLGNSKF